MTTVIHPERIWFGTIAAITYGGDDVGASEDPPKVNFDIKESHPDYQQSKGPVMGTVTIDEVLVSAEFSVSELTAALIAAALPGSVANSTPSVGSPIAGVATTLAADPALGATNLKLTSVTTVTAGDFVRVGAAGVAATEANSEVVRVLTVGTTGSGGTGCDIENDAGGGMRIDHANGAEVKTVAGSILAAPAAAGATNIKVDAVPSGLAEGEFVRVGYGLDRYETREIAVGGVGTAGPSGTGLTFTVPLMRDHSLDEWCIKVTALGTTRVTWTPGRVPSSSYKTLGLSGLGLDGAPLVVTILNAMSTQSQSIAFAKGEGSSLKLKMLGYYDPAAPTVVPAYIDLG
jgi:hypothetical protein